MNFVNNYVIMLKAIFRNPHLSETSEFTIIYKGDGTECASDLSRMSPKA